MKITARLTSLALAVAAFTMTAAPAHAVGESTVSATTAYAGDNCINHPINYSVNLPADAQRWYLDIDLIYPDGQSAGPGTGTSVSSYAGFPLTGTTTLQICGKVEPHGTWTLQPVLKTWTDAAGKTNYDPINGTPSSFQVVGQATTSASLKARTKGNTVKARTKLVAKTDGNVAPVTGQPVSFQKKKGKTWKTFKTVTTSSTGVAKVKFKAKRKTLIRARFAGAGEIIVGGSGLSIPAATSKTVRVG